MELRFLDAPVLDGVNVIVAETFNFIVGGDDTNERMSYSFFGMPNCFTLVATQVPLGISKKE